MDNMHYPHHGAHEEQPWVGRQEFTEADLIAAYDTTIEQMHMILHPNVAYQPDSADAHDAVRVLERLLQSSSDLDMPAGSVTAGLEPAGPMPETTIHRFRAQWEAAVGRDGGGGKTGQFDQQNRSQAVSDGVVGRGGASRRLDLEAEESRDRQGPGVPRSVAPQRTPTAVDGEPNCSSAGAPLFNSHTAQIDAAEAGVLETAAVQTDRAADSHLWDPRAGERTADQRLDEGPLSLSAADGSLHSQPAGSSAAQQCHNSQLPDQPGPVPRLPTEDRMDRESIYPCRGGLSGHPFHSHHREAATMTAEMTATRRTTEQQVQTTSLEASTASLGIDCNLSFSQPATALGDPPPRAMDRPASVNADANDAGRLLSRPQAEDPFDATAVERQKHTAAGWGFSSLDCEPKTPLGWTVQPSAELTPFGGGSGGVCSPPAGRGAEAGRGGGVWSGRPPNTVTAGSCGSRERWQMIPSCDEVRRKEAAEVTVRIAPSGTAILLEMPLGSCHQVRNATTDSPTTGCSERCLCHCQRGQRSADAPNSVAIPSREPPPSWPKDRAGGGPMEMDISSTRPAAAVQQGEPLRRPGGSSKQLDLRNHDGTSSALQTLLRQQLTGGKPQAGQSATLSAALLEACRSPARSLQRGSC